MGRPDFGRSVVPPVPHHLHDDDNVVDGDAIKGIQHGLSLSLSFRLSRLSVSWLIH